MNFRATSRLPARRRTGPRPAFLQRRLAALGLGLAGAIAGPVAVAQTPSGLGGFAPSSALAAGYIGLNLGKSGFDPECRPGFGCDKRGNGYKVALGAQGTEIWGAEISYTDLGEADAAGGSQKASGFTISGLAGLPLGPAFSVFARLGLTYARTRTSATAPGVATGSENGFGPSYGVGLTYAFDPRWSLVAEYDQYRIKFAPGRQTVDFLSVGVRYRY